MAASLRRTNSVHWQVHSRRGSDGRRSSSSDLDPVRWTRGLSVREAGHDLHGRVIAGSLSRRALALVGEWAALHQDELSANWDRARLEQPLVEIDPLP